jgi:hypothetical protein
MGSERTRIKRSFARTPGAEAPSANGEVVAFRDEWGAAAQTFDFAKLGLSREIIALFADAFRMHYAGATAATRKGCWKASVHSVASSSRMAESPHLRISQLMRLAAILYGSIASGQVRVSGGRYQRDTGCSCT